VGEESPEMIAIFEFSDAETIKIMLNSDDFTKLNLMISDEI
jgi:hypothetical protein